MSKILALLATCVFLSTTLMAQEESEKPKKRELPKSGVLATATDGMNKTVQADKIWGDDDSGLAAPIAGGVSKAGPDTWMFTVSNADPKDTYYAYVTATFKNQAGGTVTSATMSVTLKPGEKQEKEVRASSTVTSGVVTLNSWDNLTAKKEKSKRTPTPAPKVNNTEDEQRRMQEEVPSQPTPY